MISCYHTQLTYLNGETHFGLFTGWMLFVFAFIGFNLKHDGVKVKKSTNLVFLMIYLPVFRVEFTIIFTHKFFNGIVHQTLL